MLTAYFGALFGFLILDAIWLGLITAEFFQTQLGYLLRDEFKFGWALVLYAIYAAGVTTFGIRPALTSGKAKTALMFGGFFGFCAYTTYDLTNYVTVEGFPLIVVFVDVTWGACVTAVSAWTGWFAATKFAGNEQPV